ncbi:12934_t:CDS:2 [Entrophospora sp. SA101]|nr:12934_t:CDS:2 [Entrophospora sp. SA101]
MTPLGNWGRSLSDCYSVSKVSVKQIVAIRRTLNPSTSACKILNNRGYEKDQIIFEHVIRIGRDGHNSLRVDLVVSKNRKFFVVVEVKNNSREIDSAIKHQLIPAMRILNARHGIYFDGTKKSRIYTRNEDGLLGQSIPVSGVFLMKTSNGAIFSMSLVVILATTKKNIRTTIKTKLKYPQLVIENNLVPIIQQFANQPEQLFIIGGREIFYQTYPFADQLYISVIKEKYSGNIKLDFFPELIKDFQLREQKEFSQFMLTTLTTRKDLTLKISNLLNQITKPYLRNDLLPLQVGEKVEVITKIQDKGNKEKYKLSSFKGIIIAQKRKKQISYNFTVLHESNKLTIKQIFFYHSPLIAEIKKLGKINQKVRRAKLYFLERKLAARKAGE